MPGGSRVHIPGLVDLLCEMVAREFAVAGCYGPLVAAFRERKEFEKQRAIGSDDRRDAARARLNIGRLASFMRAAGVEEGYLVMVTIPAQAVALVRVGLLGELGNVAGDIHDAIGRKGYDERAAWYAEPLKRQDATRALLDCVGWENVETPRLVTIYLDVREHREALVRALRSERDSQIGRAEDPDIPDGLRARAAGDRALLEKLLAAIGGEQGCVSPATLLDARRGERRLTPEEFEQHFGRLPTDGEG
jgi:hypothetical protein